MPAANKMFLQWCRDELVLSSIFVQRFVSWDKPQLRKGTTAETQTLCTMPRDRFGASNIGTFACRTFPRDTKASKRANCYHPCLRDIGLNLLTQAVLLNNSYVYVKK
jgi:hypothetical protein